MMRFNEEMKVSFFFAWFDLWIGAFYDRKKHILYICPLPMCVIKIEHKTPEIGPSKIDPTFLETDRLTREQIYRIFQVPEEYWEDAKDDWFQGE